MQLRVLRNSIPYTWMCTEYMHKTLYTKIMQIHFSASSVFLFNFHFVPFALFHSSIFLEILRKNTLGILLLMVCSLIALFHKCLWPCFVCGAIFWLPREMVLKGKGNIANDTHAGSSETRRRRARVLTRESPLKSDLMWCTLPGTQTHRPDTRTTLKHHSIYHA